MKTITSKTDFKQAAQSPVAQNNSKKNLVEEVTKTNHSEKKEMIKQTVRLNSIVEVRDISSKKDLKIQIVMPDFADSRERRISVFAPISKALMGFKETDTIHWKMPTGEISYQIMKVVNA